MLSFTSLLPVLVLILFVMSSFEIGQLAITRNLKWKKDETIREAVHKLNNSYVKIISHNTHLEPRREYTIQLVEDPSVQLAVPKKKLRHLSRIMVYDYSNERVGLLMQKYYELTSNPVNHVIVLPFYSAELEGLIQYRYGNIYRNYVWNLVESTYNILFTRRYDIGDINAPILTVAPLRDSLKFIAKHIPNELWVPMKRKLFKWINTKNDPQYYIRLIGSENWIGCCQ